jgi:hypothetical protein
VTPRGPWLSTHPRQLQIALERYSFTGDGNTDSASTEWLVFSKASRAHVGAITAFGYKPHPKRRHSQVAASTLLFEVSQVSQGNDSGPALRFSLCVTERELVLKQLIELDFIGVVTL